MRYTFWTALTLCMLATAGSGMLQAQVSVLHTDSLQATRSHHPIPTDLVAQANMLQRHARGISLCLDLWRKFLFDLAASGSEQRQLAEIAAERNRAGSDYERNLLAIREAQFCNTIIEYALESRYYTRIHLDSLQLRKIEQLAFYAGAAIERGQTVIRESTALAAEIEAALAGRLPETRQQQLERLQTETLPAITAGVPLQTRELQFYLEALPALQQLNRLKLPEIAQNLCGPSE